MKTNSFVKHKNLIARIMLVIMLSLATFSAVQIITMHNTYADDPDADGSGDMDDDEIFDAVGSKNLGFNAYVGSIWLHVKKNLVQQNLVENLKFKQEEVDFANELWGHLAVVGVCFAVIYFIMDLNRAAFMAASNWTMQSLISPMLKFGACMFVIQHGAEFVSNILGFGNWLITQVAEDMEAEAAVLNENEINMLKDLNLGIAIAFLLCMLLMWIVSQVIQVIFLYKCIVYKIEMTIRCGVTPVVLGDVWEGKNSGAVRWLKKLAGCAMYGAMFLVVIKVGMMMQENNFVGLDDDAFDFVDSPSNAGVNAWKALGACVSMIVIPVAELGALGAAKQACMEVWQ